MAAEGLAEARVSRLKLLEQEIEVGEGRGSARRKDHTDWLSAPNLSRISQAIDETMAGSLCLSLCRFLSAMIPR
jgi:hypothetical protein